MNYRTQWFGRQIDPSQLPLKPISTLRRNDELIRKEDQVERLGQIHSLPLRDMIRYIEEVEDGKVLCTICVRLGKDIRARKEDWATWHFRVAHWELYCSLEAFPIAHVRRKNLDVELKNSLLSHVSSLSPPMSSPKTG